MADERGVDSGTFTRQLLFTGDVGPEQVRRYGGAIAAIARDASFSGWEAEAPDAPVDPAEVTAILTEVAARYIERLLATAGPRVVVIDDLHWLDPSSVGMVALLVEISRREPLVVLVGTRPGVLPGWIEEPDVTRLELAGLSEPETARLVTLVARAALDADDARSIHERTGGNPLFVGETVRAFLEDGTLEWRDGRVALTEAVVPNVPVTLRAVLGARIDALEPEAREAIGVASVVGITFQGAVVEELLDAPLRPGTLQSLADAALVVPTDEDTWRFAHALIHDAAYAGLLTARRRALHARLADRLEARARPTLLVQIAGHRAAAGDTDRAVPLLREAADSAISPGCRGRGGRVLATGRGPWECRRSGCGRPRPGACRRGGTGRGRPS